MHRKLFLFRTALAVCLLLALALPAFADGADGAYAGTFDEFARLDGLQGVFVADLPDADQASVFLGSRQLRRGDVLTANELQYLTVEPAGSWAGEASVCFLPVCGGCVGEQTVLTMHVEPAQQPAAPDQSLEVYRSLPGSGVLRAAGEGELTFRLAQAPGKGTLELESDGAYTYTPRPEVIGEDFFTFTVTDGKGRESAPARVRITIRKPLDSRTFADLDRDGQFAALWLREQGLLEGGEEDGRLCFYPERTVSRMDFLEALMELADLRPELGLTCSGFADEKDLSGPRRAILAAAQRLGLARGFDSADGPIFLPNQPVKVSEAVMMVARTLDGAEDAAASGRRRSGGAAASAEADGAVPAWAGSAAGVLASAGLTRSEPEQALTRLQAAELLCRTGLLLEQRKAEP